MFKISPKRSMVFYILPTKINRLNGIKEKQRYYLDYIGMISSPFLDIPKELLENIFHFLDIQYVVSIKKLHPFTTIQRECDRSIKKKLDVERVNHDFHSKFLLVPMLYTYISS